MEKFLFGKKEKNTDNKEDKAPKISRRSILKGTAALAIAKLFN